ncbi:MAG TPA: VOC family protein [Acidimicrobiia bacterium]
MEKRVTAKAFHEAPGVEDWRILYWGAHAHYRTPSFVEGAALVDEIARIGAEMGRFPDVDLRPEGVTIKTFARPDGSVGESDVEMARRISVAARELGLEPDPSRLKVVGVAVAQDEGVDTRPFWNAVLGYVDLGDEDSIDPTRRNPHFWFHPIDPPKPGRGRYHIDVSVPADEGERRLQAALAAGGRLVRDNSPEWWTIASPDNHGVDIAIWPDNEDYQGWT